MKLGIIGLPNVGKSTLFNALTNAGAASANYPFCTIDPNVGVVTVPDARLDVLEKMYTAEKKTPAYIEFVDIAGLVEGASKGEGLGNKFLSHIREVDAVVHVVRVFESGDIVHVSGNVDPIRDLEIINMELIYSDIEILERRVDRVKKQLKGDKSAEKELALLERVLSSLNGGKSAGSLEYTYDEAALMADIPLLSRKKVIYAANVSEDDIAHADTLAETNENYRLLCERARAEGAEIIPVCAGIEADIAELPDEERAAFLDELGISVSGLDRLIAASYRLLGLLSFLTAGAKEVRAWTIRNGTKAPGAAGVIHTDFERGFIRAEVVKYDDLVECGSTTVAKERGLMRSEGKDYIVTDGDVILFRFNV